MLAEILPKLAAMEAEEDRPYYPRPSLASPEGEGKDERCLVYWGLGIPKSPMPGRAILTMDDSSWHEILTADWINKSTYKLHSSQMAVEFKTEGLTIPSFFCKSCNKEIPKQDKLHGHIDGIITDMLGIDRLWENKAINHFTFNNYWQGMMPIEYFTQVGIYHNALTEVIPDIKEVLLLIKNKNTAQFIEYLIGIEKDKFIIKEITHSNGDKKEPCTEFNGLIESAINKFKRVDEYIKKKTIPKRGYEINTWKCEYCQYYEHCYQNYKEEFEALTTDAVLEGEITDLAKYYLETNMHIKEMEKEKDELNKKIKIILEEKGISSGRAGDYIIKNQLIERKSIDSEKIPIEVFDRYSEKITYTQLRINKAKQGG